MNTKTTLPVSEARKKIFKIIDETQRPGVFYTLTTKGRPRAVIMSASEFESWQETLEAIKDIPDLKKDLEETKQALKSGKYMDWSTLGELLIREGFLVAEKPLVKYGIPNKNKAKGRKRARQNS